MLSLATSRFSPRSSPCPSTVSVPPVNDTRKGMTSSTVLCDDDEEEEDATAADDDDDDDDDDDEAV